MDWKYDRWASAMAERYGTSETDLKAITLFVYDRDFENYTMVMDGILEDPKIYRATLMRVRFHRWWESVYEDSWLEDLYYWFSRQWERLVRDPAFERRMRRQRAKRGFCDRDVWNLDVWLTTVLPDALEELSRTTHGYPTIVEALSRGEDPYTYKYSDSWNTTEEDGERYAKWWKDHLMEIAFNLREANENTCTVKNGEELVSKHHFDETKEFPFCYTMVDDCTEEERAQNKRYFDREMELSKYRSDCFKKAMTMLSQLHGVLWD